MSRWDTSDNSPARRLEHELRYAVVAPLVREAELWVDLGWGDGLAARGLRARSSLLVDVDDGALSAAAGLLPGARTLRADLGTPGGAAAVRAAIGDAAAVVTCFETLAHLEDFVPCVRLLLELGSRCAVVLSVPNDAFWAVENPLHPTTWGEGAFDELRRLLPGDHLVLEQVPLAASAIVGAGAAELPLDPVRIAAQRVPSHFVLAFGPGTNRLAPIGATRMLDAGAERRLERERDSELAVLAARVAELQRVH
jgi:hypothetical protein